MNACATVADSPTAKKRSGGPRTREGKEASRKNALKHGLRSQVIFPDDMAEVVENRVLAFSAEFAPTNAYETTLVRDMAVSSARIERCASLSVADLVRAANRAADHWDDDRSMSVEDYASRLGKDPSRIAAGLNRSRHGCEWLIPRWESLIELAETNGKWDENQRRLAHDLLGVPVELRPLDSRVPAADDATTLIAIARDEISRLNDRIESGLEALDDSERELAMLGMPMSEDIFTARLRKAESRARNDFNQAQKRLSDYRAGKPVQKPRVTKPETDKQLTSAAADNLFKRSQVVAESAVFVPKPVETPVEPTPVKGNRRYRKEMARREREAARPGR